MPFSAAAGEILVTVGGVVSPGSGAGVAGVDVSGVPGGGAATSVPGAPVPASCVAPRSRPAGYGEGMPHGSVRR